MNTSTLELHFNNILMAAEFKDMPNSGVFKKDSKKIKKSRYSTGTVRGNQVRGNRDTNPMSDTSEGDLCSFVNKIRRVAGKELAYRGISAQSAH